MQRHARSAFLGGAVVFPGGKVDPGDGGEHWAVRTAALPARIEEFASERATARALGVAACREALEEGAILPVDGPLPDAEVVGIQREFLAGTPLEACLGRRGLRLDLSALVPFSRWVTPEAEARRFDARFFLLALPAGQVGRHDDHETTMSFWAAPADVLERATRGEIFLAPPTSRALEHLSEVSDLRGAFALAAQQCLAPICPRFVAGEPSYLALPGDPSHEIRERRSAGPTRYVLREGRFISEDPPPPGNP
ncbi:NUDIX hydrolase [Chondromyces apiculatus]|uniref:NUDIX hydrolase n=1 Tax=Chondromyces apiculatus DSM 436 TaxID=1192034 RepID=A0A017TGI1_9BACT|nr:hypothetical protein [Chondromyces apiculatus]EYF07925.1 NUDIX hydrolase [Chondromyces apiculatus DSM 436]